MGSLRLASGLALLAALLPAALAEAAPPRATITAPVTLTGSGAVTFDAPVRGASASNVVLRISWTSANIPAAVACRSSAGGTTVPCDSGPARAVILTPRKPLVSGQRYAVIVNPSGAAPLTGMDGAAVAAASRTFRASTAEQENSAGAPHAWRWVKDSRALGGSYHAERTAGAKAVWPFRGTSVAWQTIAGPDQGIADVYVDGVRTATFDQYAASRRYGVARRIGGLGAGAHRLVVAVRGRGSARSSGAWVAIDGFEHEGTLHVSPKPQMLWRRASSRAASEGAYAMSAAPGATIRFRFRGPGIDWVSLDGPDRGRASLAVDGVFKGTVDLYAPSARATVRRLAGFSDIEHTLTIRVHGSKSGGSRGVAVAVDRFAVRRPGTAAFGGLGAWVDLFDSLEPRATVRDMASHGVRTLYIQTSRLTKDTDIVDPARMGRWVEEAHAAGMKIVGWYLPGYGDMARDVRRTVAIARFRSPAGQRFDAIGVDIEYRDEVNHDNDRFNAGIVTHLRRVRAAVGLVPIAGIVPSPVGMSLAPASWAGFPWSRIAAYSDVVMPMAYWSYRKDCDGNPDHCAYRYTLRNVALSRAYTKGLPVHDIGGVGNRVTTAQIADFVRAARESSAHGASIYDYATTRRSFWPELEKLRSL